MIGLFALTLAAGLAVTILALYDIEDEREWRRFQASVMQHRQETHRATR